MCSYRNISDVNVTRLIEDIHIGTWKACNEELSIKANVENQIASVYKKSRIRETKHLSNNADSSTDAIGSTVRFRCRKSISGHNFQTIGKIASNDFNYHT